MSLIQIYDELEQELEKTQQTEASGTAESTSPSGTEESPAEVTVRPKTGARAAKTEGISGGARQVEERCAGSEVRGEKSASTQEGSRWYGSSCSSSEGENDDEDMEVAFTSLNGQDLISVDFLKKFALEQAMEGIVAEEKAIQKATTGRHRNATRALISKKMARLKELQNLKAQVQDEQKKSRQKIQEERAQR